MTEKYYVSGCVDYGIDIETVEDDFAEFWTLYERDEKGLSQGVVDFRFREDAEAAMAVYAERDALQQQVNALAGENAGLKAAFHPESVPGALLDEFGDAVKMDGDTFWEGDNSTSFSWVSNEEELIKLALNSVGRIETPATDDAIRELQAQGVEILTSKLQKLIDEGVFDAREIGVAAGVVYEGAQIAAQLRNEGGV